MAKLINRKTGKEYPATEEQVKAVKENSMTKDLFAVVATEVPEEVMKKMQGKTERVPAIGEGTQEPGSDLPPVAAENK